MRRWLFVEQPGPWGADAVLESQLPIDVATELAARAELVGARLILIRRPHGTVASTRTAYAARTDLGEQWVERLPVERPTDLLDLDLSPLVSGAGLGGDRVEKPLHLVCTNGRHDACCAEYGRPLAAALAGTAPGQVWECSHIGGDRFAANMVSFPHGLYFGRVDAADGPRVAALYEEGHIDLAAFRGRCTLPFVAQAAEGFLREATGHTGVDDFAFEGRDRIGDGRFRIRFSEDAGGGYAVEVQVRRDGEARLLTCSALTGSHAPRYELVGISGA